MERAECVQLLARGSYLGRVAFVRDGLAHVIPVNYVVDAEAVMLRTAEGTSLSGLEGQAVAFEVDETTPMRHSGWSVLARGTAGRVTDEATLTHLRHSTLRAWGRRAADCWIRIPIESITGRRIEPD